MGKIAKTFSTLAFLLILGLTSCGDDKNEPQALNQWEKQLIGQWDEVDYPDNEDSEYFHYILTNDKTGIFVVTLGRTQVLEEATFNWSADKSTLKLSSNGNSESTPYKLTGNTLVIGVGEDALTYKRTDL